MSPVFMAENIKDTGYAKGVGANDAHLKISVVQQDSHKIDGIGFNMGEKLSLVTSRKPFSAVFSLDENEWQGNVSLQLKLKDIK
jgi:single-stranded-DNA-specific exonuclease